jgi:hypothetical protein
MACSATALAFSFMYMTAFWDVVPGDRPDDGENTNF